MKWIQLKTTTPHRLPCASQFWGTMNVLICCFCHLMKTKKKTRKSLKNNKNKGQFNFFNFWTECWSKIWVNLFSFNISQHFYAHGNPGGITLMTSFLFLMFEKKIDTSYRQINNRIYRQKLCNFNSRLLPKKIIGKFETIGNAYFYFLDIYFKGIMPTIDIFTID